MRLIKIIFPYTLAIIIILLGYFSIDVMKKLIPSHKETIRVFDKPDQNNLFYIGKSDELVVYPWDMYDEGQGISVNKYFDWKEYEYEFLKESLRSLQNPDFLPNEKESFMPNIIYYDKLHIYFIKDHVYTNSSGKKYVASFVFTDDIMIYLHCEEYDNKDLTLDEIQKATLKINGDIKELNSYNENIEYVESNPLISFFMNFPILPTKGTPIIVPYKGELLLIYEYDNYQVILYYNPRIDIISGYSLK